MYPTLATSCLLADIQTTDNYYQNLFKNISFDLDLDVNKNLHENYCIFSAL